MDEEQIKNRVEAFAHLLRGGKVEFKIKDDPGDTWELVSIDFRSWDHENFEFRIVKEPEYYHQYIYITLYDKNRLRRSDYMYKNDADFLEKVGNVLYYKRLEETKTSKDELIKV